MSDDKSFDNPQQEADYWKNKYEKTEESKKELEKKVVTAKTQGQPFKPPPFTILLLIAFLGMFIWQVAAGGMETFKSNPLGGPSNQELIDKGAKYGPCIRDEGQWWRFFSMSFLHAGIIQLIFNLIFIGKLGYDMELVHGPIRVPIVWLVGTLSGALFSALFAPNEVSVGSDNALFSWMGMLFVTIIKRFHSVPRKGLAIGCMICNVVFMFVLGLLPGIDNWGHLGAFLGGLISSTCLVTRPLEGHVGLDEVDLPPQKVRQNRATDPDLEKNDMSEPNYKPDDGKLNVDKINNDSEDETPPPYEVAVNSDSNSNLEKKPTEEELDYDKIGVATQSSETGLNRSRRPTVQTRARSKSRVEDYDIEEKKEPTEDELEAQVKREQLRLIMMDAVSQEKRLAEVIIFGILTVGFLVTLFLVYYVVGYDGKTQCTWCHWFDCVDPMDYGWCTTALEDLVCSSTATPTP